MERPSGAPSTNNPNTSSCQFPTNESEGEVNLSNPLVEIPEAPSAEDFNASVAAKIQTIETPPTEEPASPTNSSMAPGHSLGSQARAAELQAAAAAKARLAQRELEDKLRPPTSTPVSLGAFSKPKTVTRNKGAKAWKPLRLEDIDEHPPDVYNKDEHTTVGTWSDRSEKLSSPFKVERGRSARVITALPVRQPNFTQHPGIAALQFQPTQPFYPSNNPYFTPSPFHHDGVAYTLAPPNYHSSQPIPSVRPPTINTTFARLPPAMGPQDISPAKQEEKFTMLGLQQTQTQVTPVHITPTQFTPKAGNPDDPFTNVPNFSPFHPSLSGTPTDYEFFFGPGSQVLPLRQQAGQMSGDFRFPAEQDYFSHNTPAPFDPPVEHRPASPESPLVRVEKVPTRDGYNSMKVFRSYLDRVVKENKVTQTRTILRDPSTKSLQEENDDKLRSESEAATTAKAPTTSRTEGAATSKAETHSTTQPQEPTANPLDQAQNTLSTEFWNIMPPPAIPDSLETAAFLFPPPGLPFPKGFVHPQNDYSVRVATESMAEQRRRIEVEQWFKHDGRGEEQLRQQIEVIARKDAASRRSSVTVTRQPQATPRNGSTRSSREGSTSSMPPDTTIPRAFTDPSNEGSKANATNIILGNVIANLQSYLVGDPEEQKRNFANFRPAPDWCCDRTLEGRNSFFGGDWQAPPARIARDPRYHPVETVTKAVLEVERKLRQDMMYGRRTK